jgi:transcriptional regulator with XRE-family HTH domain
MPTGLQRSIEKQRAIYESMAMPLLYQLARMHGLTIREFAEVFEISRNHAEGVLKHRVIPSLELAFQIARYFDVTVDQLFGWLFDDTGNRRPLVLEIKGKAFRAMTLDPPLELIDIEPEAKK